MPQVTVMEVATAARGSGPGSSSNLDDDDGRTRQQKKMDKRTMSHQSNISTYSGHSQNNSQLGDAGSEDIAPFTATTAQVLWALLFRASASEDMQVYLKQIRHKSYHCPVISSTGNFRSVWDITSLFFVLYCTFSVPYEMTFEPPKSPPASIVDMIVESFFIIEINLNFFTSYIDPNDGEEVCHPLFIATEYCKAWLPIDLVSSIPSEIVTRVLEAKSGGGKGDEAPPVLAQLRIIRILRLTKLLRLLRIKQLMEQIELSVPAMRTVFGLFRLLFMMLILAHIQACVFFLMAKQNLGNSWVSKFHAGCCDANLNFVTSAQQAKMKESGEWTGEECFTEADLPSLEVLYTNSIYWSFTTLTSVGYGEITPCNEFEMLYCTVGMLLGSGMFAYIVGNISEVITAVAGQKIALKEKMRELQEYIVARKLPKEISTQLRQQCLHRWTKIVFSEDAVLEDFTPQMRRWIVEYVNLDNLKKIGFLEKLLMLGKKETELLKVAEQLSVSLAALFQPSVTNRGDDIVLAVEDGSEFYKNAGGDMYIITLGSCRVERNGKLITEIDGTEATPSTINELEMLSELMTRECLHADEVVYLKSNLPAEFQEVDIADLLPLQHVKRYLADTDVESLRLSKTDVRDALDRTNDSEGYSVLRFALVKIFTEMLRELDDVDKKTIVERTKKKREAMDKKERAEKRKAEKAELKHASVARVASLRTPTASPSNRSLLSAGSLRRNSSDVCSSEDLVAVLSKVKEMHISIEAQSAELRQYMQSMGVRIPDDAGGSTMVGRK